MNLRTQLNNGQIPSSLEDGGGRYGRLFPDLAACSADEQPDPIELGNFLHKLSRGGTTPPNVKIAAGYTFFGQFVVHDLTSDPSPIDEVADPDEIYNQRTPSLDLDSLYGRGPESESRDLYEPPEIAYGKFRLGPTRTIRFDLPRDRDHRAFIADPRNDHNRVLSQLHVAFLKFHNYVMDRVAEHRPDLDDRERFEEARRLVRWHYQWIVRHEYLPLLCRPEVLAELDENAPTFYRPGDDRWPYIPVEFSVAAMRAGHSQVGRGYKANEIQPALPVFAREGPDLRGNVKVTKDKTVDWQLFFPLNGNTSRLQLSRGINTILDYTMQALPAETLPASDSGSRVLGTRDLVRALNRNLPCGDTVAKKIRSEAPTSWRAKVKLIENDDLWPEDTSGASPFEGKKPPLWYYVLREAELQERGERLGFVGSCIVAEVICGILRATGKRSPEAVAAEAAHDGGHDSELARESAEKRKRAVRAQSQAAPANEAPPREETSYWDTGWTPAESVWLDPERRNPEEFRIRDLLRLIGG